jgi:hypothetical protein
MERPSLVSSVHTVPNNLEISQLRDGASLPMLYSVSQLNALFPDSERILSEDPGTSRISHRTRNALIGDTRHGLSKYLVVDETNRPYISLIFRAAITGPSATF